jgi:hypothetical protein
LTQNAAPAHFAGLVPQKPQLGVQATHVDVAALRVYPVLQVVHLRVTGSQNWQFESAHFAQVAVAVTRVHPVLQKSHLPDPALEQSRQFGAHKSHPPVPFLTGPREVEVHCVHVAKLVQAIQFGFELHAKQEL